MNKKDMKRTNRFVEELEQMVSSLKEDVNDSKSIVEAWNKIDRFFYDMDRLRRCQPMTKSKSGIKEDREGHTKFIQGVHLPIVVNSICDESGNWKTSACGIRVGKIDGEDRVIITPDVISIP